MDVFDHVLRQVIATQRTAQEREWARICLRLYSEFGLRLSPESYREVAQRVEQELLPTVPEGLQRAVRELIRSLIQDAQYFSWLRDTFGAAWKQWRGAGHPQFGDLRGMWERERHLVRSPYAYPYASAPREGQHHPPSGGDMV